MPTRTAGAILGLLLVASAAGAEEISVAESACLPQEANAAVYVRVPPSLDVPAGSVRLFFRRLNPVGAFYYQVMWPTGGGAYWGVLPRPEDREQELLDDDWWAVLKTRDWMRVEGRDREWLEDWLAEQQQEAAEVYAAVYDAGGTLVERSDVRLVPVRDDATCSPPLSARERGLADNLSVGETTDLQVGRQLFHWLCNGVVSRISPRGLLRADEFCRRCLIAAQPDAAGLQMAATSIPH